MYCGLTPMTAEPQRTAVGIWIELPDFAAPYLGSRTNLAKEHLGSHPGRGEDSRICDALSLLTNRQLVPLEPGFLAMRAPVGWIVAPNIEIGRLLHLSDGRNMQEPGTIRLVQEQLPLNGRAIDVGAHIGMSTVPMARAVGPSGRVDALEPCRPNSRPCDVQLSPMVLIQRLRL